MNRVQYIDLGGPLTVGHPTIVKPYDHPNDALNRTWTRTTPVQQVIDGTNGPVFRTANTIYRPLDNTEPLPVGNVQFHDHSKTPFKRLEVSV